MANRVAFSDDARADLRAIDRETALRLLKALARFLSTESGDIKQLEGFDPPRYRLRVGDWRFIFRRLGEDTIEILNVRHRSEFILPSTKSGITNAKKPYADEPKRLILPETDRAPDEQP